MGLSYLTVRISFAMIIQLDKIIRIKDAESGSIAHDKDMHFRDIL
jgi:hypothetical protein